MEDSGLVAALDQLSFFLETENSVMDLFPELDFYGFPLPSPLPFFPDAPVPVQTSSPFDECATPTPVPASTSPPPAPRKPVRSIETQTDSPKTRSVGTRVSRKLFKPVRKPPPIQIRFRGVLYNELAHLKCSPVKVVPDLKSGGYQITLDAEEIFNTLAKAGTGSVVVRRRNSPHTAVCDNEGNGEFILDQDLVFRRPIVIDLSAGGETPSPHKQ